MVRTTWSGGHGARWLFPVFVAFMSMASAGSGTGYGSENEIAREILDATGVKGGLIVHLGCGDGQLTAALRANDSYLVHGLDLDAANVEAARRTVRAAGLYGKVAVDRLSGDRLPYAQGVVNLLVADSLGGVSQDEVLRVLAPGGTAYVKSGAKWETTVKPVPADVDEWTHFLYGPSGNAVSADMAVDVPYHVQWVAGPRWARSHDQFASVNVAVSSNGRLFSIVDDGPIASVAMPSKWFLVARDAFSGVELWRRPVGPWETQLRNFRSGPAEVHRRLVAIGDRVYASLGYNKPLLELDAATGETLQTYPGTDGTLEIVHSGGVLYVVTGTIDDTDLDAAHRRGMVPAARNRKLMTVDADSGKTLWAKADADTDELMPLTLAVAGNRVLLQNPEHLVCLVAASGEIVWRADHALAVAGRAGWCTPTLVVADYVVLVADRARPEKPPAEGERRQVQWTSSRAGGGKAGEVIAFAADTGKRLWSTPAWETYSSPIDVFVVDSTVWIGKNNARGGGDFAQGHDLHTGQVVKEMNTSPAWTRRHHHRCYRNKATPRHILLGRTGIGFIDLTGEDRHSQNCWVRGTCQFGVLPANGLIYAPPHSCACYIQAKLAGYYALAPKRKTKDDKSTKDEGRGTKTEDRLEKGPAYADVSSSSLPLRTSSLASDWPTYRGDAARSGFTAGAVPTKLGTAWTAELGEAISSPVIADGKVFVACVESHAVCALDATTGKQSWRYVAGGRIDSPPTVADGLAVFGSRDGFVYCLRADDGELAWRFRAAPQDQRLVSYEQVESVWPVHGNVLVDNGDAYFVAGRSGCLDGGLHAYRLKLNTGELLAQNCIYRRDPDTGQQLPSMASGMAVAGGLPDVLAASGENIYMRNVRFDRDLQEQSPSVEHMYSPAGYLDDAWWHRTYWVLGTSMQCGYGGWSQVGNRVPSGRLLVMDDANIYGWGRTSYSSGGSHIGLNATLHLFGASQQAETVEPPPPVKKAVAPAGNKKKRRGGSGPKTKVQYHWTRPAELFARAMVLADKTLFVAGPLLDRQQLAESFAGARGVVLRAISTANGDTLSEIELDAVPVFDGLAAADGNLYVTTNDGKVTCLSGK